MEVNAPLRVVYDYALLERTLDPGDFGSRGTGLRRFDPLLPLRQWPDDPPGRLRGTPRRTLSDPRLPAGTEVTLKDETRNPTGTVRDRATMLALNHALVLGRGTLVSPAWRDVGSSLAGLAHRAPLTTVVVASGDRKRDIGSRPSADVYVHGSGDGKDVTARRLARAAGWYDRSPHHNPYLLEAYKTIAFEMFESGGVPDTVVYLKREGNLGGGLRKGFRELHQLGWIRKLPRLVAVRPDGDSREHAPARASGTGWHDGKEPCLRPGPDAVREVCAEVDGAGSADRSAAVGLAALRLLSRDEDPGEDVVIVARGTRRNGAAPERMPDTPVVEVGENLPATLDRIRSVLVSREGP